MITGIFGFQSTLPARGATWEGLDEPTSPIAISIHAPREGSDMSIPSIVTVSRDFNPRSPRGERLLLVFVLLRLRLFQSTLPARGATIGVNQQAQKLDISIHAPREGSDIIMILFTARPRYFNPRSPRGERHCYDSKRDKESQFQSTLPARGATRTKDRSNSYFCISIHAPREGSDGVGAFSRKRRSTISIHAPREGSDIYILV